MLTIVNYAGRMDMRRPERKTVTLTLQDAQGVPWPLRLSADCLRFVGRYRRIDGFNIDAILLFDGVQREG